MKVRLLHDEVISDVKGASGMKFIPSSWLCVFSQAQVFHWYVILFSHIGLWSFRILHTVL